MASSEAASLLRAFDAAYRIPARPIDPTDREKIILETWSRLQDRVWAGLAFVSLSMLDIRSAEQAIPVLDLIRDVNTALPASRALDHKGWDIPTILGCRIAQTRFAYMPITAERWTLMPMPVPRRWWQTQSRTYAICPVSGTGSVDRITKLAVNLTCAPEKADECAAFFHEAARSVCEVALGSTDARQIYTLIRRGTQPISVTGHGWTCRAEWGPEPLYPRETPSYRFSLFLSVTP
jgi:hypothetical protein